MNTANILLKEKIISLSDLQRNPGKALDAAIVRIVKNGKEIGIFMSTEEFEDFVEEHLALKSEFQAELDTSIKKSKKKKSTPLADLLS